ncbi:MAG: FtsW/RodA/SpoVE family cell cycle protein [Bacilli bacterium]|nr:FtsW/RodA/SpoVE family cell cycle protein [Bacilli bacterium]
MRKTFKYMDKPLFIVSSILFVIGLIMVFSASNVTAYMSQAVSPYNYFIKQAIFLGVGLFISFFVLKFSTRGIGIIACLLMLLGLAVQASLPFVAPVINDSRSWLDFKFFTIQPSEFMKVISIVWLAFYYDNNKNKLNKYTTVFFPIIICLASAILIYIEPDLGTMLIYGTIVAGVFLIQPVDWGIKLKTAGIVLGIGALGVAFMLGTGRNVLIDRQKQRLDTGSPCEKLLTTGNQICNGYIAINNGGLKGVGLGNSTQKYLYLPEPYTDFIFCIIIEELGLITGIAIILMYMFVLWRIIRIGRRSNSNMGATMCYGIALYIFIHIAVNLLGLLGVIPMTGVPLPFMSYGGSFTICLLTSLTLVQKVCIES